MSAEPSLTPIDYAAPTSRVRKRIRRGTLAAVLLLVAASSCYWCPRLWHRAQLAFWYHRCLLHEPPAGTVVQRLSNGAVQGSASAGYVPRAWREFYGELSPPGFRTDGTAFLGARRTPRDREVLLAVDVRAFPPRSTSFEQAGVELHVRVFSADGSASLPRQVFDSSQDFPIPFARFRVLAGSADPGDSTHFTITLAPDDPGWLNTVGRIEGWIRDDGVELDRGLSYVTTPPPPKSPG
jgi:hypothetical protein